MAQNYVYLCYDGSYRRFPVRFLLLLYVMTLNDRVKLTVDCSFIPPQTSQMELPDDVLGLIREYSKPAFKYFREYNRALKVLDKEEWKALKEKLIRDGEVIPTLHAYLESFIELQKAQIIHWDYYRFQLMGHRLQQTDILDELNRKCNDVELKTDLVKSIYRKLVVQIYGKSLPECALYGYD